MLVFVLVVVLVQEAMAHRGGVSDPPSGAHACSCVLVPACAVKPWQTQRPELTGVRVLLFLGRSAGEHSDGPPELLDLPNAKL